MKSHKYFINRLKDQRGQSSVFLALTTVVFVALLAFLANIGQVIHDKILSQAVADAAALSAANIQTIGMNEIADLNAEIEKLVRECKTDFSRANYKFAVGHGRKTWRYYSSQIQYLYELQDKATKEFASMANEAAKRVVELNNEKYQKHPNNIDYSNGYPPTEKWTMETVMGSPFPSEELAALSITNTSYLNWTEYACASQTCATEMVGSFSMRRNGVVTHPILFSVMYPGMAPLTEHKLLEPFTKVYYRLRVKRNPTRSFVNLKKFGFEVNIPDIVAYSQAQPHKGNIETTEPEYEPRLVPLWQTYPNETDDADYLDLLSEIKH